MFIKQISIFLENTRGSLRALIERLGKEGIDLLAVSIADTQNFGIVRCVVRSADCERAQEILKRAGYSTRINNVVCVAVPDRPMGLAEVLALLDDNGIFIEYTYSFVRGRAAGSDGTGDALIIFRLSEPDRAQRMFAENGVRVLAQGEVDAL